MKERCSECKFWDFNEAWEEGDCLVPDDSLLSYCRRYPPFFAHKSGASFHSVDAYETPVTMECAWCGEFKPKEQA